MTSGVDGALGDVGEPPPQLSVVNRPMTTTKGWRFAKTVPLLSGQWFVADSDTRNRSWCARVKAHKAPSLVMSLIRAASACPTEGSRQGVGRPPTAAGNCPPFCNVLAAVLPRTKPLRELRLVRNCSHRIAPAFRHCEHRRQTVSMLRDDFVLQVQRPDPPGRRMAPFTPPSRLSPQHV